MAQPRYWIGQTVRVRVAFSDETGTALAPTGVTVSAKKPDGTPVSGTVVQESDSTFHCDILLDAAGDWHVRASCTGPVAAATEMSLTAVPSGVL